VEDTVAAGLVDLAEVAAVVSVDLGVEARAAAERVEVGNRAPPFLRGRIATLQANLRDSSCQGKGAEWFRKN